MQLLNTYKFHIMEDSIRIKYLTHTVSANLESDDRQSLKVSHNGAYRMIESVRNGEYELRERTNAIS